MKKTVLFGLLVILQAFIFLGCDKENSNSTLHAQSANDAQRIVGTWKPEGREVIFTFNANGTYTVSGSDLLETQRENGNYFVNNQNLIRKNSGATFSQSIIGYYLSADGRNLVFSFSFYNPNDYIQYSGSIWLIKQ